MSMGVELTYRVMDLESAVKALTKDRDAAAQENKLLKERCKALNERVDVLIGELQSLRDDVNVVIDALDCTPEPNANEKPAAAPVKKRKAKTSAAE